MPSSFARAERFEHTLHLVDRRRGYLNAVDRAEPHLVQITVEKLDLAASPTLLVLDVPRDVLRITAEFVLLPLELFMKSDQLVAQTPEGEARVGLVRNLCR